MVSTRFPLIFREFCNDFGVKILKYLVLLSWRSICTTDPPKIAISTTGTVAPVAAEKKTIHWWIKPSESRTEFESITGILENNTQQIRTLQWSSESAPAWVFSPLACSEIWFVSVSIFPCFSLTFLLFLLEIYM